MNYSRKSFIKLYIKPQYIYMRKSHLVKFQTDTNKYGWKKEFLSWYEKLLLYMYVKQKSINYTSLRLVLCSPVYWIHSRFCGFYYVFQSLWNSIHSTIPTWNFENCKYVIRKKIYCVHTSYLILMGEEIWCCLKAHPYITITHNFSCIRQYDVVSRKVC